jgi:L-2-hydroxyglutarate oxidase LhgO
VRIVVIGAGAVGMACARSLQRSGHEVFALEAAGKPGTGISSRNSEVLHAGIYYPQRSAKAALCVEGADLLFDYLTERGESVRRCGKLVVAAARSDLPRLEALHDNARACGVRDLEALEPRDVARREPLVRCAGALWSPRTGILDSAALVRALAAELESAGGTLVTHAPVTAAEVVRGSYRLLVADRDSIECDGVVNAAGLESDRVARLPGPEPARDLPFHHYYKGSYFRLHWPKDAAPPPGCLVYPLPSPGGPGLGVHLTLDLGGGLRLGPDSERLPGREESYGVDETKAESFESAARSYLALPEGARLSPDIAGIRPIRSDVEDFGDFYIAEESARGLPRWINLIGIDSPGLTACLAIARVVAERLRP